VVKTNNIIEINGKHYNVNTGAIVASPSNMKAAVAKKASVITKKTKTTTPATTKTTKTAVPKKSSFATPPSGKTELKHSIEIKPNSTKAKPLPITEIAGHTPQAPKTLMRKVVEKPSNTFHQRLRAQSPTDVLLQQPTIAVPLKLSIDAINNQRLKHARVIPKSQLISHYTSIDPNNPSLSHVQSQIDVTPTQHRVFKRVAQSPQAQPKASTTEQLLQRALERATSHEQPPYRPARSFHTTSSRQHTRRLITLSSTGLVAVLLIGFVVHSNLANIRLQLASAKAGFAASIPANQPAGLQLNSLNSSVGNVTLHFSGQSSQTGSYTLSEQASTWDSSTLREMYVNQQTKQFQTVIADGNIIYIYGNQNATWVNDDIWYQIHSDGSLSNQQLIATATSL
jgi:hypothetical protein